jgi:glycosyltransferase involved in cell wall biosynthesis
MRIALVWNADARLIDITVRHERYARGFEALGHEVTTVCTAGAGAGYPHPTLLVRDREQLADSALWRAQGFDVALLVTWHRMPDVLAALRSAGTRTVAIADSDGQVSARVHPRRTLAECLAQQPRWDLKLRAAKAWLLRLPRQAASDDRAKVESTRHSDVVVFGTERARRNFCRLLRRYGADGLCERTAVAPHPVDEEFCERLVNGRRPQRLIAIGRWDSPQKDGPLLEQALRLYLGSGGRAEVLLIGRGGEELFADLVRQYPQVRYLGVQPAGRVADLLAESRSLIISSRWESGPIVAWEALALGASVVGTPIPNLTEITGAGQFGRVSVSRRPADLAAAIRREMAAWDAGRRDPRAIAEHWRPRLHPAAVCRAMIDALAHSSSATHA